MISRKLLLRFIKFGIVGSSGMIVNSAVLWLLHDQIGFSIYAAGIFAIGIAIFTNFNLNDYWTWSEFKSEREHTYLHRLWRYYVTASIGALINYLLLLFLTKISGLYYLYSNLIGILAGMSSNFVLSELWVFRKRRLID